MKTQPAARYLAIIVSLLLIALGCIAGRELWIIGAHPAQSSWVEPVLQQGANLHYSGAVLAGGIVCGLVGLLLLIPVFRPRRDTHLVYRYQDSDFYLRPVDVARMLTATAVGLPDIRNAETTVTKKKATIRVSSDFADPEIAARVQHRAEQQLQGLTPPLQVSVDVKKKAGEPQ